jgi:hypothetical protein
MIKIAPQVEAENVCEHGDHAAPPNKRFCSKACQICEVAPCDHSKQECAGICLQNKTVKNVNI